MTNHSVDSINYRIFPTGLLEKSKDGDRNHLLIFMLLKNMFLKATDKKLLIKLLRTNNLCLIHFRKTNQKVIIISLTFYTGIFIISNLKQLKFGKLKL